MKRLIFVLWIQSQICHAGGSQIGTLEGNGFGTMSIGFGNMTSFLANSSFGNFGYGSKNFGGSQVGTLDNSSVGNFKTAANNGFGTMGGSSVGNFKSAGNSQGNFDNSQVGTLGNGSGTMNNRSGTMKLTGGGGGLRPESDTKHGGHEV